MARCRSTCQVVSGDDGGRRERSTEAHRPDKTRTGADVSTRSWSMAIYMGGRRKVLLEGCAGQTGSVTGSGELAKQGTRIPGTGIRVTSPLCDRTRGGEQRMTEKSRAVCVCVCIKFTSIKKRLKYFPRSVESCRETRSSACRTCGTRACRTCEETSACDIETHSAVRSMVLVKADEYRQWPRTRGSGALCSAKLAARCGAGLK